MLKSKFKYLYFSIFTLILGSLPGYVFAQNNQDSTNRMQQAQERLDTVKQNVSDRQQAREERMEQHCEMMTNRIQTRLTRFADNRDDHVQNYMNLRDRITEIVSSLDEKGYDTEALAEDLATIDGMITEYGQSYNVFISLLEDSEDYACGESQGSFADSVKTARDQLKLVHEKRKEIRDFYLNEVREDIKDLRQQTPVATDESSNEIVEVSEE